MGTRELRQSIERTPVWTERLSRHQNLQSHADCILQVSTPWKWWMAHKSPLQEIEKIANESMFSCLLAPRRKDCNIGQPSIEFNIYPYWDKFFSSQSKMITCSCEFGTPFQGFRGLLLWVRPGATPSGAEIALFCLCEAGSSILGSVVGSELVASLISLREWFSNLDALQIEELCSIIIHDKRSPILPSAFSLRSLWLNR